MRQKRAEKIGAEKGRFQNRERAMGAVEEGVRLPRWAKTSPRPGNELFSKRKSNPV